MTYFNFQFAGLLRGEVVLPDYDTDEYHWLMDAVVDHLGDHFGVEDSTDLDATGEHVEMNVQGLMTPVIWLMRHCIDPQRWIDFSSGKPVVREKLTEPYTWQLSDSERGDPDTTPQEG